MFGPRDGYVGFPSRSKVYAEDLMSLNTLNSNDIGNKKYFVQGESRSLKTDDIPGAKPKSGIKRYNDQVLYTGLNLPSYNKPANNKIEGVSNQLTPDYLRNLAAFFGTTPPSSNKTLDGQYSEYKGGQDAYTKGNAPNPYGVDSVQSRVPNTYEKSLYSPNNEYYNPDPNGPSNYSLKQVPSKAAANFYGVTPPPTGNKPSANFYAYENKPANPELQIPNKSIANFYGVTPPPTGNKSPINSYGYEIKPSNPGPQIPDKNIAYFYGVTPPPTGSKSPVRPYGYDSAPYNDIQVPSKNIANFYGVTPPPTGSRPPYGYDSKPYNDVQVPNKSIANFYGVTPPPTGSRAPMPPYGYDAKPDAGVQIPDKSLANFYGVTPPATGQKKRQANDFNKNALKFFGHDSIDPEFQYAADIINKPPESYQQNPYKPYGSTPIRNDRGTYNFVSTAKRIFN